MPKRRNRNYRREYDQFHAKPEQKKRRASRNTARRRALSKGSVKKGDSKEVHHKDKNPRNNSPKNLQVVSRKWNRTHQ